MKKLSDKTVVILCVISVIAVLASSFWYVVALTEGDYLKKTIKEQQSASQAATEPTKAEKVIKDTDELKEIYKGDDISKLQTQRDKLKAEYDARISKDRLIITVKEYIKNRHETKSDETLKDVIPRVEPYITKQFKKELTELSKKSAKGNMFHPEDYTIDILAVYTSDIYIASTNNNYNGEGEINLPILCDVYVKYRINDSVNYISSLTLSYENEKWVIVGESNVSIDNSSVRH